MPHVNEVNQEKKVAKGGVKDGRQPDKDALEKTQEQARDAANKGKDLMVSGHRQRLELIAQKLEVAEQNRSSTLENLSDRLAILNDDRVFMYDLVRLTQEKLQRGRNNQKNDFATEAMDAFVEAFDEVTDWNIPLFPGTASIDCKMLGAQQM